MKARYRVTIATGSAEVETHLAAWWELHAGRLEDDVRAAPAFLGPIYRQLQSKVDGSIAFVYRHAAGQPEMVASAPMGSAAEAVSGAVLGEFDSEVVSSALPMLHRDFAADAMSSLWQWFGQQSHPWSILCWPSVSLSSPAWKYLAGELGAQASGWCMQDRFESPTLHRRTSFDGFLQDLPRPHRDASQAALQQLRSTGPVQVKLHRSLRDYDLIPRFLMLDRAGSGGRKGATQGFGDAALFASVTEAMGACHELFFVEILVDGVPISISAGYVDGTTIFSFKTVCGPTDESVDPDLINVLETTRLLHQDPILQRVQAISNQGSWASQLWTDAAPAATVLAATRESALETAFPPRAALHAVPGLASEAILPLRGAA